MLLLGIKLKQNFINQLLNKKSEQKSALNSLNTRILRYYTNLNSADSGHNKLRCGIWITKILWNV